MCGNWDKGQICSCKFQIQLQVIDTSNLISRSTFQKKKKISRSTTHYASHYLIGYRPKMYEKRDAII